MTSASKCWISNEFDIGLLLHILIFPPGNDKFFNMGPDKVALTRQYSVKNILTQVGKSLRAPLGDSMSTEHEPILRTNSSD